LFKLLENVTRIQGQISNPRSNENLVKIGPIDAEIFYIRLYSSNW